MSQLFIMSTVLTLFFMLYALVIGVKMTELKDVCELARELVVKYDTRGTRRRRCKSASEYH